MAALFGDGGYTPEIGHGSARLEGQTGGLVSWRDLTALPCSHPHCCSIGYLLKTDGGEWKSLAAIVGHDALKAHLGLVSNRIVDPGLSADLRRLVHSRTHAGIVRAPQRRVGLTPHVDVRSGPSG